MSSYGDHLKALLAHRLNQASPSGITLEHASEGRGLELLQDSPAGGIDALQHDVETRVREMWKLERGVASTAKVQALGVLSREFEQLANKLAEEPMAALSLTDESVLESMIALDGTRPSLLIGGDTALADHPMAGEHAGKLRRSADMIGKAGAATGRIQPSRRGGPGLYFGTGFLVSSAGLVLTNLHVADKILRKSTTIFEPRADHHRILTGVEIDFAGETQSRKKTRFNVVEIRPLDTTRRGLNIYDVAVLKLGDPVDPGDRLPEPLEIKADVDAEQGALGATCTVGFPGRPAEYSGAGGALIQKAIEEVFDNRFGLKRIAPGLVNKPSGTVAGDMRDWIFGHDMSTLGGASGSPVMGLSADTICFGLHFSGERSDVSGSNLAHGFASDAAHEALAALGIAAS